VVAVTLVEDEVDDGQYRGEPFGQARGGRHGERDARRLDFGLGPGEAPFHRLGRDQEGPRDLFGGEPAHGAERKRDLRLDRERRMAAHEDELKPFVGDGGDGHVFLP
jgi:hypothetical protein